MEKKRSIQIRSKACEAQNLKGILRSWRSVSLPSTLKEIGDWTFYRTAFTRLKLPAGLKTIGEHAFSTCALESVDLSGLKGVSVGTGALKLQ